MPAWMTSLLREETPFPMPRVFSATMTSWPASAAVRATLSPTTPAPTTRICIVAHRVPGAAQHAVVRCRPGTPVTLSTMKRPPGSRICGAPLRVAPRAGTRLLRRDAHLWRGGAYVGVDIGLELGEVLLEHAHELARGGVELGLVLPGLERVEQVRLDARHADRHLESEIGIGAELARLERPVEGGGEQRARHLDRHAAADAVFAARPAGVDEPAIDAVGGD